MMVIFFFLFFFLRALFQFGLTIAPIQNSGLINAKMVVDDLLKSLLDDYQFSLSPKIKKSNLTYDRARAFL